MREALLKITSSCEGVNVRWLESCCGLRVKLVRDLVTVREREVCIQDGFKFYDV
jgi:hypothetical protein